MYKIERQEKILDYINKNNRASIAELSEMFKVSKVTISNRFGGSGRKESCE